VDINDNPNQISLGKGLYYCQFGFMEIGVDVDELINYKASSVKHNDQQLKR
jgi:hypothetical protein